MLGSFSQCLLHVRAVHCTFVSSALYWTTVFRFSLKVCDATAWQAVGIALFAVQGGRTGAGCTACKVAAQALQCTHTAACKQGRA